MNTLEKMILLIWIIAVTIGTTIDHYDIKHLKQNTVTKTEINQVENDHNFQITEIKSLLDRLSYRVMRMETLTH